MEMNNTIWKQADSRWGSKYYPVKGSSFSGNGCGCCACVHVAMEQKRYKNWTPESLRPWMVKQGFAVKGQGTRWEGITQTLKHIGHSKVVKIYDADPMSAAWKELNKGNRIGVLLLGSGKGPDGTVWTASGHYVAFVDYKVSGGKHWFYCKDSGGRNHDGWYCYETSMKGRLPKLWIVERVGEQVEIKATSYRPSTPYTGSLPNKVVKNGSKGSDVKAVQKFLNWCINAKLSVDGDAGALTEEAICIYQITYGLALDGVFGPASKKKGQSIINAHKVTASTPSTVSVNAEKIVAKAKEFCWPLGTDSDKWAYKTGSPLKAYVTACKKFMKKTSKISLSDCGYFVSTCVRAAGVDSDFTALAGTKDSFPKVPSQFKVAFSGKKIPDGTLLPGDIIRYKKTNGGQHTLMYYSKGVIAEAGRETRFPVLRKDKKKYNADSVKHSTIQVLRAK